MLINLISADSNDADSKQLGDGVISMFHIGKKEAEEIISKFIKQMTKKKPEKNTPNVAKAGEPDPLDEFKKVPKDKETSISKSMSD